MGDENKRGDYSRGCRERGGLQEGVKEVALERGVVIGDAWIGEEEVGD